MTASTKLSPRQLNYLRGLAHTLKPVVAIGHAGVSAAVVAETDTALEHHELIKVRLPAIDRKLRRELLNELADGTESCVVQTIGRIGTLFRATDKKDCIQLPAARG